MLSENSGLLLKIIRVLYFELIKCEQFFGHQLDKVSGNAPDDFSKRVKLGDGLEERP